MEILQLLSAITTRVIFLVHSILSFYILHYIRSANDNGLHWLLIIPLLGLLLESVLMLWYTHNEKWTFHYVWPAGLFYISCIIPVIIIMELELFEQRLDIRNGESKGNLSSVQQSVQLQDLPTSPVWGLTKEVFARKFCELGLFLGLLLGRWLTPRGNLTREQLSSLMLGYVCTISDILEALEAFNLPEVMYERSVNTAVILLFTLATYQFSLITVINNKEVLTLQKSDSSSSVPVRRKAFMNKVQPIDLQYATVTNKSKMDQLKAAYIENIKKREQKRSEAKERGKGVKRISSLDKMLSRVKRAKEERLLNEEMERRRFHKEIFQMLVTILMQDGPFLILRLYVIIIYGVDSEMHLFFTCKNIITIILLVNRILILTCHEDESDIEEMDSSFKLYHVEKLRKHIWNSTDIIEGKTKFKV